MFVAITKVKLGMFQNYSILTQNCPTEVDCLREAGVICYGADYLLFIFHRHLINNLCSLFFIWIIRPG